MDNERNEYTISGREYLDMIAERAAMSNGKIAFYENAICKYICRYPMEGKPIQDLMKARECIDMLIRELQQYINRQKGVNKSGQ